MLDSVTSAVRSVRHESARETGIAQALVGCGHVVGDVLFEALLDGEGPENVNPTASREQQLANIRSIYGPEKAALGALAVGIARVTAGQRP